MKHGTKYALLCEYMSSRFMKVMCIEQTKTHGDGSAPEARCKNKFSTWERHGLREDVTSVCEFSVQV